MKKFIKDHSNLVIALVIGFMIGLAWAADTALVGMTNDASPTDDDVIYSVNDPSGTPGDRKVTWANLWTYVLSNITDTIGDSKASPIIAMLNGGLSANIVILGDSTSVGDTLWVYDFIEDMAADYSTTCFRWREWADSNIASIDGDEAYGPWEVVSGAAYEEYFDMLGVAAVYIDDAEIPDFTTDADVRVRWTMPGGLDGANRAVWAHFTTGSGGNRMYVNTSSYLVYQWVDSGTTTRSATSTVTYTIPTSMPAWVRVTHDVDNGSSDSIVKFYTSTDGDTWSQLGADVAFGATTDIAAVNTNWELGALASTNFPTVGRYYDYEFLNGIQSANNNPRIYAPPKTAWTLVSGRGTIEGQTISIYNGSKGGVSIAYHDDSTLRPLLNPAVGACVTMISLSHNGVLATGYTDWMSPYGDFITNLKSNSPASYFVLLTQNPETSAATYGKWHAQRRLDTMILSKNTIGTEYLDVYQAFLNVATWESTLMTDTVHPNQAGSELWADEVWKWFKNTIP